MQFTHPNSAAVLTLTAAVALGLAGCEADEEYEYEYPATEEQVDPELIGPEVEPRRVPSPRIYEDERVFPGRREGIEPRPDPAEPDELE